MKQGSAMDCGVFAFLKLLEGAEAPEGYNHMRRSRMPEKKLVCWREKEYSLISKK
jgi:hypothetical protein